MKTDLETLRDADWKRLERDVVLRIRVLAAAARGLDPRSAGAIGESIANDVILPNLLLLGRFCAAIEIEEDERGCHDS